jgi:glutamate-1-semialdehyde 2,1-aminomutase
VSKQTNTSKTLFEFAKKYIPGGVDSPVRSFYGVGGTPIFMERGTGAYVYDVDQNQYLDYVLSWGPFILGHAYPKVISAVKQAVENGLGFGTPTEIEGEFAAKICGLMPTIEMLRFVNSGTEACMTALRIARGYTQKNKLIKFSGCYHGHSDAFLVKAGSGALTLGVPTSAGVPQDVIRHTLTADFNDLDSVEQLFAQFPHDIAAVIVEPIAGNMNCVPATPEFLTGLRALCTQYKSLLIFDEVMTGFRITLGGAQHYFNVKPDLTTLGKVIGGGLPVGAVGGSKEIMSQLAPLGSVYQAGTLSGNPIAMTAGLTTVSELTAPHFYEKLNLQTEKLVNGLANLAAHYHIPFSTNQVHSMFGFFFTELEQVNSYADVMRSDVERFKKFYHAMLAQGVYLAPSAFEAGFTSSAHQQQQIDETLTAAETVFKKKLL